MYLKINDVEVAAPKVGGISRKEEKIWSANTGRTASGRMQGTIIGIKKTLSISWPPLTKAQVDDILALVSDPAVPFSTVEMGLPDGGVETVECYFGTPSVTLWSWLGGGWRAEGLTVDGIER